VFDIYGDGRFDYDTAVYVQLGFNGQLRAAVPLVQGKMRSVDKRTERGLRERADEALTNLKAFIKYKDAEYK
jgi:hypothetical protein